MSLEELSQKFERWRENRVHPRAKVPKELWNDLIALVDLHGITAVSKASKIASSKIRLRMNKTGGSGKEPVQFVRTTVATPSNASIVLTTPSGVKVEIF